MRVRGQKGRLLLPAGVGRGARALGARGAKKKRPLLECGALQKLGTNKLRIPLYNYWVLNCDKKHNKDQHYQIKDLSSYLGKHNK